MKVKIDKFRLDTLKAQIYNQMSLYEDYHDGSFQYVNKILELVLNTFGIEMEVTK